MALVHHARCLRPVPAGSERAHEQAVPGFTQCVARDQHPRRTLGLGWPLLIDLGLHDGLERLQLDVGERSPLGLDPVAGFSREKPPRRDLVRDDRLGPRSGGVASPPDRLDVMDRIPGPFAIDEDVGRERERVAPGGGVQLDAWVKATERGAQPADDRVEARVRGVRLLVAPERGGDLAATYRPSPIQYEIRPELSPEPSRQRGFVDHRRIRLDPQAAADGHPHATRKAQRRRATIRTETSLWEDAMKFTVTIRGRLREGQGAAKKYHDDLTRATKDAAKQAGDLTHVVYLDPQDPKAFLGIDTWSTLEGLQKFAASPQIKEFFAKLFEGEPEVRVWVDSDWNTW